MDSSIVASDYIDALIKYQLNDANSLLLCFLGVLECFLSCILDEFELRGELEGDKIIVMERFLEIFDDV
jgi:hypothetical protein